MEGNRAAAVKAVGTIVDGQLVAFAVQAELSLGDTVSVASDQCAEVASVCSVFLIVLNVVMSKAYILHVPVFVRHHDADNSSAEVCEAYFHAVGIGENIQGCGVCREIRGIEAGGGKTLFRG